MAKILPGARIVRDQAGNVLTDPALELSSDFDWAVTDTVSLSADTSALISDNSRAEQVFALVVDGTAYGPYLAPDNAQPGGQLAISSEATPEITPEVNATP